MRKTKNLLVGSDKLSAIQAWTFFGVFSAAVLNQGLVLGQGTVDLEFSDSKSGEPVSARILFTKSAKRLSRPKKLLYAGEQWLAEKKFQLTPPNGDFEFLVQRGPEFSEIHGGFSIEPRAKDKVPISIPRTFDSHAEFWFSGDHFSGLPLRELLRWQAADAVDMVLSTDANETSNPEKRKPDSSSSRPQSDANGLGLTTHGNCLDWEHGALLLVGDHSSIPKSLTSTETIRLLENANQNKGVVAELIRPWTRDVPFLLATQNVQSVQILSSCNRPAGDDRLVLNKNADHGVQGKIQVAMGKQKVSSDVFSPIDPDETIRFRDARAVGKLSEAIYWQMLEAGLRITPTAGSGFQSNDTHVGYNRVYIYSETPPDEISWWQSIAKGNTFVTNGPLLRANINGAPPGSVHTSYRGQSIPLDIAVSLSVREPVDYLDVVFNGEILYSAKLEDHYKRGEFPPIEIDKSGWLVIRVVTENAKGYRYATTAPFHFIFDAQPRVSRKAVAFFQAWHQAAVDHIQQSPAQRTSYESWVEQSKQFWNAKLTASNCD